MRIVRISSGKQRVGREFETTLRRITWTKAREWIEAVYRQSQPATKRKICDTLNQLERWTDSPHDVEPSTIADSIVRWQVAFNKPTTINSKLRVLRTVLLLLGQRIPECRLAWEGGRWWIREDDDWTEDHHKHLTPEQILNILAQADREILPSDTHTSLKGRRPHPPIWYAHRRRALVWLLASTGLRAGEALTARTIEFDGEILMVTSSWKRTKTKASAQPVPVIEEASRRLYEWFDMRGESEWIFPSSTIDRPWLSGSPGYKPLDQVKQLASRAGVNGVTLLSFRHTFATLSELWGLTETQIQRILRHTTPLTQRHYRAADRQILRAIAKRITFKPSELLQRVDSENANQ